MRLRAFGAVLRRGCLEEEQDVTNVGDTFIDANVDWCIDLYVCATTNRILTFMTD